MYSCCLRSFVACDFNVELTFLCVHEDDEVKKIYGPNCWYGRGGRPRMLQKSDEVGNHDRCPLRSDVTARGAKPLLVKALGKHVLRSSCIMYWNHKKCWGAWTKLRSLWDRHLVHARTRSRGDPEADRGGGEVDQLLHKGDET